jgi:hypothetical protein
MLPSEKTANQQTFHLKKAEEDSLALWREVILGEDNWKSDEVFRRQTVEPERRVLRLVGRYQVGDGSEFDCEVNEISPLGLSISGPKEGHVGQWCTTNVAAVGIVEGIVIHAELGSLTIGIIALPSRIRRLGRRFRWQLQQEAEPVQDRRSSERIEMKHAAARLKTAEGQVYPCQIFDISEGGAALHLGSNALYFWAEQPIVLDERPGHILRIFPGGFVVRFD